MRITRMHLAASAAPTHALTAIKQLQDTQAHMRERIDRLYNSLNIGTIYPELGGLPVEFVRVLLAARDLKISLRKRAIANFLEWDRLDQAAGGKNTALGQFKLHRIGLRCNTD